MRCFDCRRRLRDPRADPAKHPGTLKLSGRGRCSRCLRAVHERERAGRPEAPLPSLPATVRALDAYLQGRDRRRVARAVREQRVAAARDAGLIPA